MTTSLILKFKKIYMPGTIDSHNIPYANTTKCFGTTLDPKHRWKEYVKMKRQEVKLKLSKMM